MSQENGGSANSDGPTGLFNRPSFFARIAELAAKRTPTGAAPSVLRMARDGIKPIKDRYGHRTGDRVLAEVGLHLQAPLSKGALVAWLRGDDNMRRL